jgi:hypothetical protein
MVQRQRCGDFAAGAVSRSGVGVGGKEGGERLVTGGPEGEDQSHEIGGEQEDGILLDDEGRGGGEDRGCGR